MYIQKLIYFKNLSLNINLDIYVHVHVYIYIYIYRVDPSRINPVDAEHRVKG